VVERTISADSRPSMPGIVTNCTLASSKGKGELQHKRMQRNLGSSQRLRDPDRATADSRFGVKLWVRNALNEHYATYVTGAGNGNAYAPAPQATYGTSSKVKL
jgi:hypothetical protein